MCIVFDIVIWIESCKTKIESIVYLLDIYNILITYRSLSDENEIIKKELEKDDYNVVDDAHSTLGDSDDKLYENIKGVADKNKEHDKNKDPNMKKKN